MFASPGRLGRIAALVSTVCGVQWIYDNVGYVAKVEGSSMQPVLNPDGDSGLTGPDLLVLCRINGGWDNLRRGDIITALCPYNSSEVYIKRIVGLPGDVIKTLHYRKSDVRVPEGHCWIEGDNHRKSIDSNEFGPVPLGLIQSKAVGIVWPSERRRYLAHVMSDDYARRISKFIVDVDDDDDDDSDGL